MSSHLNILIKYEGVSGQQINVLKSFRRCGYRVDDTVHKEVKLLLDNSELGRISFYLIIPES